MKKSSSTRLWNVQFATSNPMCQRWNSKEPNLVPWDVGKHLQFLMAWNADEKRWEN